MSQLRRNKDGSDACQAKSDQKAHSSQNRYAVQLC